MFEVLVVTCCDYDSKSWEKGAYEDADIDEDSGRSAEHHLSKIPITNIWSKKLHYLNFLSK